MRSSLSLSSLRFPSLLHSYIITTTNRTQCSGGCRRWSPRRGRARRSASCGPGRSAKRCRGGCAASFTRRSRCACRRSPPPRTSRCPFRRRWKPARPPRHAPPPPRRPRGRTDHRFRSNFPRCFAAASCGQPPRWAGSSISPGTDPAMPVGLPNSTRSAATADITSCHLPVAAAALAVAFGVLALQVGAPSPEARYIQAHGHQHRRLLATVLARANVALLVHEQSSRGGGQWMSKSS